MKWYHIIENRRTGIVYTGMNRLTSDPEQLLNDAIKSFPQYCNLSVEETTKPKMTLLDELVF